MKKIAALISFLAFSATGSIFAQSASSEHVKASLITEVESIQPGEPFWVGVNLEMEPGWHTYWKQAGDTGFATAIDWRLPEGFTASEICWPMPERTVIEDLVNFSYENKVLLLVKITPPLNLAIDKPITLAAEARWLACNSACIPESAELKLTLPVKETAPNFNPQQHKIFEIARKTLPQDLQDWKVEAYTHNGVYGLLIEDQSGENRKLPDTIQFYSYNNDIKLHEPQNLEKSSNGYFLSLPLEEDIPAHLEGILINPQSWIPNEKVKALAIDIKGHKEESTVLVAKNYFSLSFINMLFFAFMGGLVLNLMPCVFPVLGLKIMSFVKYAGESAWKARMHGLVFTLGVLVSFWILSGLLLALRAGGSHLGWGFQLQSPFFITFLCFLLLLLALNFLGTFEMGLSLMSVGNKLNNNSGYTGSFLSGILATVLATPCTGPFLGTTLGLALAQPPIFSMSIFTAMALGMASPYLILTFFPVLLKYLPRPGPWMETFKQAMAFPLLATVIWLLWVFGQQTHHDALTGLLFGLLLASTGAWIYGRFVTFTSSAKKRDIGRIVSILFFAAGIVLGYTSAKVDPEFPHTKGLPVHQTGGLAWEKFSLERLEELQAEGRSVFIDFTAAWCLTCQTNKKNVFSSDKVIEKFKEKNIALLHADWTKGDDEITKALQSYGRSGVPTNVFYPAKGNGEVIVLPELLTPNMVLEVLD